MAGMETLVAQQKFWNHWNATARSQGPSEISRRQADFVRQWLLDEGRQDLRILEVGCGSGWLSPMLTPFGRVTATDLSDDVLDIARQRWPSVDFVAGDFAVLPFEERAFDVIVSLEVLSHVEDQPAFAARLSNLLAENGLLILATQNRPVLRDHCSIPPPQPGQLRKWVDRAELLRIFSPHFDTEVLVSATPVAHRGWRRLLTSARVNRILHPLIGHALRDFLEARQWGWTLMLKARKHADVAGVSGKAG